MGGYLGYLGRLFAFALRGSVREADKWQILTATALPSAILGIAFQIAGALTGISVSEIDVKDYPIYLGYGLMAWVAVRFFLIGPYFLYAEQLNDAAGLRLELSKPERMVMERLAAHRAKARAKLAAELEDLQTYAFANEWGEFAIKGTSERMTKIRRLQAKAGLPPAFEECVSWLLVYVKKEAESAESLPKSKRNSVRILRVLQRHLVGGVTDESLALQLLQEPVLETPPKTSPGSACS